MKSHDFLDRLIERIDRLDPSSVQGYILKLVRQKGLLETVFQTIREGVLIVNSDLSIQYVNRAAVNMLGIPPDPKDRAAHTINRYLRDVDWEYVLRCCAGEQSASMLREVEVFYPSHRRLQFYVLPYENEEEGADEIGMATIILHDITEDRKNTDSAIESEKLNAITMLAAGVAHEIGNPLNSLTIHLQLLERYFKAHGQETEEPMEMVAVALQEVQRLDGIITRFLKAVRPAAIELQPVALKDVISSTIEFMRREIEDRNVFVEAVWTENIPMILGDENLLKQAFYNIMKNAIQSMPDGGILKISLETSPDAIIASFADSGEGIAPDQLSNIFAPYYTSKEGGSGLGLMIVERIIRDHGAEMGVESEVDEGTVFRIVFPVRERRARLLEDKGSEPRAEGLQ